MAPPASHAELLAAIHAALPRLETVLAEVSDEWVGVDLVYRFWHHSFKCYALQHHTTAIVAELESLAPAGSSLHPWFRETVDAGTGVVFALEHNSNWLAVTRPIVDAFFHARFMLEQVVRAGSTLTDAPSLLPSGWAAVLELYQIR